LKGYSARYDGLSQRYCNSKFRKISVFIVTFRGPKNLR
jgi:hypothetical protein